MAKKRHFEPEIPLSGPHNIDSASEVVPSGLSFDSIGFKQLEIAGGSILPSYIDAERFYSENFQFEADDSHEIEVENASSQGRWTELIQAIPNLVLDQPWKASFKDYFKAKAAIEDVAAAVMGMILRPVADKAYQFVDFIPASIRRPFDRAVGILLDNLVSPASYILPVLDDVTSELPQNYNLNIPAYPQVKNGCGETMLATWFKQEGIPMPLGEVDTQLPFFTGTNLTEEAEFRKRGFSVVSGPGTFEGVKTYIAHGYPVMASIGWASGGGHYVIISGYDDITQTLTIDNYYASGSIDKIPYKEFRDNWERHKNLMTVVYPHRDHRMKGLQQAGIISREAEIQEGLSLSDFWVNQRLQFFIEVAYRYRGTKNDLTIQLHWMQSEWEYSLADCIGGRISYVHRFNENTSLKVDVEKLTIKDRDDTDLDGLLRSMSVYFSLKHKEFSGRIGYEREAFQGAIQIELNSHLAKLGAEARISVTTSGNYSVFIGAQGTF